MGKTRAPEPESHAEEAAVIASILAETLTVPNPREAVAAILLAVAPASLLVAPTEAASVAFGVASLVVQTPRRSAGLPSPRGPASEGQFLREMAYKGFYALAAFGRVALAEDKAKALERERRFFGQQLGASRQRMMGAKLNDAAAERFGPILSWVHAPEDPGDRPHHVAAHGANFDVRNPPRETEGLPGTLMNCNCTPSAPRPGARVLT